MMPYNRIDWISLRGNHADLMRAAHENCLEIVSTTAVHEKKATSKNYNTCEFSIIPKACFPLLIWHRMKHSKHQFDWPLHLLSTSGKIVASRKDMICIDRGPNGTRLMPCLGLQGADVASDCEAAIKSWYKSFFKADRRASHKSKSNGRRQRPFQPSPPRYVVNFAARNQSNQMQLEALKAYCHVT